MSDTVLDEFTLDGDPIKLSHMDRPREYFHDKREEEDERKERSRAIHESFTPERQEVFRQRMRKALLWMYDNVDDWLPLGLEWNKEGDTLAIQHCYVISDIADGEELMAMATSIELAAAVDSLNSDRGVLVP